jgi:hypothetical protein
LQKIAFFLQKVFENFRQVSNLQKVAGNGHFWQNAHFPGFIKTRKMRGFAKTRDSLQKIGFLGLIPKSSIFC